MLYTTSLLLEMKTINTGLQLDHTPVGNKIIEMGFIYCSSRVAKTVKIQYLAVSRIFGWVMTICTISLTFLEDHRS